MIFETVNTEQFKKVKEKINDYLVVKTVSVPITSIAANGTFKPTVDLPDVTGYTPIFAVVKGSGSNNIYNYYLDIKLEHDDAVHNKYYTLYSEWRNISSGIIKSANASVNVIYRHN